MMSEAILFSKHLYREEALEVAMEAYSGLASFRTDRKGDDILVFIQTFEASHEEQIRDAFCTHVLFETIVKYREATGAKL